MKGQITLEKIRPDGYEYPVGLNSLGGFTGTVEYLVVAGGGGGGYDRGGGGGAGGYLCGVSGENTGGGDPAEPAATFVASQAYTVTVGAGGPFSGGPGSARASNGSFSLISNASPGSNTTYLYAVGGGGAGSQLVTGNSGGSGGGSGSQTTATPAPGTPGQGYAGAIGQPSEPRHGGGGGGAGSSSPTYANGGVGVQSSINGTPTYRAGGGAGGSSGPAGTGGTGGGGNSSTSGTPNTGGGGGGTGDAPAAPNAGSGGKGVVIIRWPSSYGNTAYGTGSTLTTSPGYIIHTFTGDGTLTTNSNFGTGAYSIN